MVKRIINIIFPVVDLPESSKTKEELKGYFDNLEKERTKGLKVFLVFEVFIVALNLYIFFTQYLTIFNKLLLLIPQGIMIAEEIRLMFCFKHEQRSLLFIKRKDKFMLFIIVSLVLMIGNLGLAFFSMEQNRNIGIEGINLIIILGQMYYLIAYVCGYRKTYNGIVENLLIENREGKRVFPQRKAGIGGGITVTLYLATYEWHIIPEILITLLICIAPGIVLYKLAPILVRNRFFCKLYEKELQ